MKTRIISILLAVCLIFGLLPVGVLAASATSGSCGKNATWSYNAATKTLSISGSGDMTDYETDPAMGIENAPPWDDYREEIEHVIINEGIASIGAEAFGFQYTSNCYSNLSSVSIAPTVTKIGSCAFTNAEKLKSIDLPNVTSIGYAAFNGTGIQSLMLPSTLETFEYEDSRGFLSCGNLQSITVDPGNQKYRSVDGVLFAGNKLLRYPAGKAGNIYTVPSGTTWIATSAFADNENITTISIPSSVSKIDSLAFEQCSKLEKITIAEGVTRVASDAFWGTALTSIVLPASVNDFTANWGTEPDVDYLNRTFYFTGTEAPKFDTFCCNVWSGYKVVICYPENATGWDAVQQQDNVKYQVEAGVLEFKTGTPPTEPSEPTDELKLVSTSPANGATDVTEDDSLVLTFNQELSKNLNWTKGSIYIKNYNTDETALKIDSAKFYALGGTVNGNSLTVPPVFSSLEAGKYYITMDAGVIVSSDGTMLFAGIQSKQTLSFEFQKESHLYGCDFTMGRDSLSFGNYSDKGLKIEDEHMSSLLKKLSVRDKLLLLKTLGWMQLHSNPKCFGMSAVMELMYKQYIHPDSFGAKTTFEIKKDNLKPLISYCHMLQVLSPFKSVDIEDSRKTQSQLAMKIIDAIVFGDAPILVNTKYTKGLIKEEHTVLAYGLDRDSDKDNYIVHVADPNNLVYPRRDSVTNELIRPFIYDSYESAKLYIDKDSLQITKYVVWQSYPEGVFQNDIFPDAPFKITSVYLNSETVQLANLLPSAKAALQSPSITYSTLVTTGASFVINASSGKTATISANSATGNLDIIGPLYISSGETPDFATYYIESADGYKITYPDAENHDTLLVFPENSDSGGSISSTAKTVEFHNNGYVAFSEATGTSSLTLLSNNSDSTLYMLGAQTGNSDASITAVGEQYKLHSSSDFTDTIVYGKNDWCTAKIDTLPVRNDIYIKEVKESNNRKLVLLNEDGSKVSSVSIPLYVCFFSNGGSFVDAVTNIPYNSKLQQPEAPTKTGYRFAGWYKDEALTQQWRFDRDVVTEDMELYAKWVKQGQTSGSNSTSSNAPQQNDTAKDVFTDVSKTDYFYDAVLWAVENGITTGTSRTRFSPYATCTRAQAVTFLWRASGSPTPKNSRMPFEDVSPSAYYYDAVLWALEEGITTGTASTTFSPDAVIDRAQAVTLLHRANGAPSVTGRTVFTDVPQTTYYADAVRWAVDHEITTGTSAAAFSPNASCTRAQIVTFLYRAYRG